MRGRDLYGIHAHIQDIGVSTRSVNRTGHSRLPNSDHRITPTSKAAKPAAPATPRRLLHAQHVSHVDVLPASIDPAFLGAPKHGGGSVRRVGTGCWLRIGSVTGRTTTLAILAQRVRAIQFIIAALATESDVKVSLIAISCALLGYARSRTTRAGVNATTFNALGSVVTSSVGCAAAELQATAAPVLAAIVRSDKVVTRRDTHVRRPSRDLWVGTGGRIIKRPFHAKAPTRRDTDGA